MLINSPFNTSSLTTTHYMPSNTLHRFFDSSPVSACNKYLAHTKLPTLELSSAGNTFAAEYGVAEIGVTTIASGEYIKVDQTHAWDTQLGAQVQWGADLTQLYYNVLEESVNCTDATCFGPSLVQSNGYWTVRAVKYDHMTGSRTRLSCPVYHAAPDGRHIIAPNLLKLHHTQKGYGIRLLDITHANLRNYHAPTDDGLYVTDTQHGNCTILVTLHQLASIAGMDTEHTPTYGFHTKYSSDGSLIMFVVRTLEKPAPPRSALVRVQHLFVLRSDGSGIRRIISWASYPFVPKRCKARGRDGKCAVLRLQDGNHPNWVPGSHKISMNLQLPGSAASLYSDNRGASLKDKAAAFARGAVEYASHTTQTAAASIHSKMGTGSKRRRQGSWSIVSIDVAAHADDFMYQYDTPIAVAPSNSAKTVTQATCTAAAVHCSDSRSAEPHMRYFNQLVVEVGHAVGTGHPIYHPSGEYIITDAYPKEAHLLATPPAGKAVPLGPGQVPLRLIQVATQREVWLATVRIFCCVSALCWRHLIRNLRLRIGAGGAYPDTE
jgi:hypothetical protein